jgi:hypothetical protein
LEKVAAERVVAAATTEFQIGQPAADPSVMLGDGSTHVSRAADGVAPSASRKGSRLGRVRKKLEAIRQLLIKHYLGEICYFMHTVAF